LATKRAENALDKIKKTLRNGIKIIGNGLPVDFTKTGAVSLIGKQVGNIEELAVLAQVYRNPAFETFRVFTVKQGKIVGQTAVSSRVPGYSAVTIRNRPNEKDYDYIRELIKDTDADGYYILHNHPSGSPDPSTADIRFTRNLASKVPGLIHHVVINQTHFGSISSTGETLVDDLPKRITNDKGRYDVNNPLVPHDLLGERIRSPEDLVNIGKQITAGNTFQIVTITRSGIRGIFEVPIEQFKKLSALKMQAIISKVALASGGQSIFLIYP